MNREDNNVARAYEIWEAEMPATNPYEERVIRDIVSKLIRYGSISEAQINFIRNLIAKIDIEAARKAAYEAAGPAPVGRQTVTGTVLAVKTVERNTYYYGDSGVQTKLLIQLTNGSKVYGNRFDNLEKGDTVSFTATFEVSKTDAKFGFYKRAKIVKTECTNQEHSHPSIYQAVQHEAA